MTVCGNTGDDGRRSARPVTGGGTCRADEVSGTAHFDPDLTSPKVQWCNAKDSFRLDVGCPNDLGPFLGFIDDELAEIGGRARKYRAAGFSKALLQLGIGQAGVDFLVELVNDRRRRVPRRTEAIKHACLVAR